MHLLLAFLLTNNQCKALNNLKLVINASNFFIEGVAYIVECKRNVMAHAQKPDSVFQRN